MQDDAKKIKKRNFFKNKGKCGDNSWTRALDAIHIINFIWPKWHTSNMLLHANCVGVVTVCLYLIRHIYSNLYFSG